MKKQDYIDKRISVEYISIELRRKSISDDGDDDERLAIEIYLFDISLGQSLSNNR